MRMTFLKFLTLVGLAAGATLPAVASPLIFNAAGKISGGGSLSGTVTIDPATGSLVSADLSLTLIQTFVFSANVGGIPNYANSGLFVIAADDSAGGYPVALLGVQETSLVGYDGGPISPASDVIFGNGDVYTITSGKFDLLSVSPSGSNTIGTFGATGMVAGNPLGGSVKINVTTGAVLSSTVTATIPRTYKLNSNIGGVPNYANSGLFAIIVNEAGGAYPIAILGLVENDLVGYAGGPISGASSFFLADGTRFGLDSGSLTATPEPSTFACFGLAGGLLMVARWRRNRV